MAAKKKLTMGQLASLAAAAARSVDPEANKNLRRFSQVGVGLMKKSIQNYHAVDTGTMLNSTTAESINSSTILIGPTTDYATFVALGTSRVAARPFHTDSAAQLRKQIKDFGFSAKSLGL